MSTHALCAVTPVDGRYHKQTASLSDCFSEYALIFYRLKVEVAYLKALCEIPLPRLDWVKPADLEVLDRILAGFTPEEAQKVKATEAVTNHDVKAVEYYLKDQLVGTPLEPAMEFVHFGLTSQDVNNTAQPMMVKDAVDRIMLPVLEEVVATMERVAVEWQDIPMLAHTHGQPASPTFLGKEMAVFGERLAPMAAALKSFRHSGKFGGATGNFNAHLAAYPDIDWVKFSNRLLHDILGLERQQVTTQIEHYDDLAALLHLMIRINTVLLDLNRDMWTYISMNYFTQKLKQGEVGSSAMPHKVNPIDFENSEGNLGVANALFGFMAEKLPVSRLQRDLTDSTVMRNIGVPFAHSLIAWKSLLRGMGKVVVNKRQIEKALDDNWAVLAEAIQTILRREGVANPYEQLKALTRGNNTVNAATLAEFTDALSIPDSVKAEIRALTPASYTGYNHISLRKR
jgi:adenylosuccinate lyase